jgi:hypothetical protein
MQSNAQLNAANTEAGFPGFLFALHLPNAVTQRCFRRAAGDLSVKSNIAPGLARDSLSP